MAKEYDEKEVKERLAKAMERIEAHGGQVLQSFQDGVPMEKPCPHCEEDRWDLVYHGPGQAGFQCMKCDTMMHCEKEQTRYVHKGKEILVEPVDKDAKGT